MRRFIAGWKVLGYARRFDAEFVNYADDLLVLGRAPSATLLRAPDSLMQRLKLTENTKKTRCCRAPEESTEFHGCRVGRNYRREYPASLYRHRFDHGEPYRASAAS